MTHQNVKFDIFQLSDQPVCLKHFLGKFEFKKLHQKRLNAVEETNMDSVFFFNLKIKSVTAPPKLAVAVT